MEGKELEKYRDYFKETEERIIGILGLEKLTNIERFGLRQIILFNIKRQDDDFSILGESFEMFIKEYYDVDTRSIYRFQTIDWKKIKEKNYSPFELYFQKKQDERNFL